jgi:peptidoglycan-associated lipoprotein
MLTRFSSRHRIGLLALLCGGVFAGCRSKPSPPALVPDVVPPVTLPPTPSDSAEKTGAAHRAGERERLEREGIAREARERDQRVLAEPVHFAFDRSDLSLAARLALDAKLRVLLADQRLHVRVGGHADDRGPREYNMALGHRRAAAVRRYLVQRDIDEKRIETVSFGEERPLCAEPTEGCWQLNRRAVVAVVSP